MKTAVPTVRQLEFQDWEFGIFLHFGIRTFVDGHQDWDGKTMDPACFNPTEFDADQWAQVIGEAGARYAVLVAKHHDGFANWPSAYTDFSVAASPWKNGRGDVVREFTDACRRHGLAVGIYYSPAEMGMSSRHHSADSAGQNKDYDQYFMDQVSELLDGRYGKVDMLWFDGCGSEGHEYDWSRIIGRIRELQPEILIFNMGDPDYRWSGNEAGIAEYPLRNTVEAVDVSIRTDAKTALHKAKWLPVECDCMLHDRNWFFSPDDHTVKSLPELMGIYSYSVGRGANLLLNSGPDRRGLIADEDAARLREFGAEIRRRFAAPVLTLDDFKEEAGPQQWGWVAPAVEWTPNEVQGAILLDHVVIQEDLTQGEQIYRFRLRAAPYLGSKCRTIYEGYTVGHKAICSFPPIRCLQLWLDVLDADGTPVLRRLDAGFSAR